MGDANNNGYEKIEVGNSHQEPAPPTLATANKYSDNSGKFLINGSGLDMVKHFEGLYLKAYRDSVGVLTLGYGRIVHPDGKKIREGETCTEQEAESWLLHDLYAEGAKYVRVFTNDDVENKLTENQFSSLVSLVFNRGAGRYRDYVAPSVNRYDIAAIRKAILSLNFATKDGQRVVLTGLDRRRLAEAALFSGGNWRDFDSMEKYRAYKKAHP